MVVRPCSALLVLVACGAPLASEPPKTHIALSAQPSDTSAKGPVAEVTAVVVPSKLEVDGDLSEWGAVPASPTARSRVRVALSESGVAIAAVLRQPDTEGFWLGIGGFPTELPPVGKYTEIGGDTLSPEMGVVVEECGRGGESETAPACIAARKRIAADEDAYASRFVRWFRVEPTGIGAKKEGGALAIIDGEQISVRPAGSSTTIEALLPPAALPRFSEAPVVSLRLAVGPLSPDLPSIADDDWTVATLNPPVEFQPLAELRKLAFENGPWMSYQPGAPLEIEATRYPSFTERSRFEISTERLYTKKLVIAGQAGQIEVGLLAAALPADSIRQGVSDRVRLLVRPAGGAPVTAPVSAPPQVVVDRDGEAHVLSFATTDLYVHDGSPTASFLPAVEGSWSGYAIGRDAKPRALTLDAGIPLTWEDVEPFHDPTSVGMRGSAMDWTLGIGKRGDVTEVAWKWDAKRAKYVLKRTRNGRPF